MSDKRDFDRAVARWLDDGSDATPPEVISAVLLAVRGTPQERDFRVLWRTSPMTYLRLAAVVAVIAVAGVAALYAFGAGPSNVGSVGEPTPTPVPTAIPEPSPAPAPLPAERRTMEGGTYVTGDAFSVRLTVTLPAGWQGWVAGPYRVVVAPNNKPGAVSFMLFQEVSADPCRPEQGYLEPPPGPSVDDLVAALAGMPGIEVTDVADVTVDGYRGKQLTMAAPDSSDGCTPSTAGYVVWRLPLGYTHAMTPGARDRVWILDVVGDRLVIVIPEETGYTDDQRAEIQEIFDSIRIEPAN